MTPREARWRLSRRGSGQWNESTEGSRFVAKFAAQELGSPGRDCRICRHSSGEARARGTKCNLHCDNQLRRPRIIKDKHETRFRYSPCTQTGSMPAVTVPTSILSYEHLGRKLRMKPQFDMFPSLPKISAEGSRHRSIRQKAGVGVESSELQ
jgi:hypothetical protein